MQSLSRRHSSIDWKAYVDLPPASRRPSEIHLSPISPRFCPPVDVWDVYREASAQPAPVAVFAPTPVHQSPVFRFPAPMLPATPISPVYRPSLFDLATSPLAAHAITPIPDELPSPKDDSDDDSDFVPSLDDLRHAEVNGPRTKRARRSKPAASEGRIPRPPNCFMLYRADQLKVFQQDPDFARKPQAELSRVIGAMWSNEPEHVKMSYIDLADQRKLAHAEQYPGWTPTKRSKDAAPSRQPRRRMNASPGLLIPPTPCPQIQEPFSAPLSMFGPRTSPSVGLGISFEPQPTVPTTFEAFVASIRASAPRRIADIAAHPSHTLVHSSMVDAKRF